MENKFFHSARGRVFLYGTIVYNFAIYYLARFINLNRLHHDIETAFDRAVPLIPWTALIYWGCYLFWAVNYIWSAKIGENEGKRFLAAHYLGDTIAFFVFLLYPSTMPRPVLSADSVFEQMLALTYTVDMSDNLLPSIHCFASWLSWIGLRGRKEVPVWYRIFSFLFALAVCISTQTVKQHVLIDALTGVALAEFCWYAAGRFSGLQKLFDRKEQQNRN